MPKDLQAGPTRLSAPQFLEALEGSGLLSTAILRQVQDRFVNRTDPDDSLALARELVDEGTLTEFQARRLLKGKINREVIRRRGGAGSNVCVGRR